MEATAAISKEAPVTAPSVPVKFLGSQQAKIAAIALGTIALLASLVFIEVKFGAMSTALALAIANPITSFVVTLLTVGTALYAVIRICRKPTEKPRELSNQDLEARVGEQDTITSTERSRSVELDDRQPNANSDGSETRETLVISVQTGSDTEEITSLAGSQSVQRSNEDQIQQNATSTALEESHNDGQSTSTGEVVTSDKIVEKDDAVDKNHQVEKEERLDGTTNKDAASSQSTAAMQMKTLIVVSKPQPENQEDHLHDPEKLETSGNQESLSDAKSKSSTSSSVALENETNALVDENALKVEVSSITSSDTSEKLPIFVYTNALATKLIELNKESESTSQKGGFTFPGELLRLNDLYKFFSEKYEGCSIGVLNVSKFYTDLNSLKTGLMGAFPTDVEAFKQKFGSMDEGKKLTYGLAFHMYRDILFKVSEYITWLKENDPAGQFEPKNAAFRESLQSTVREQIRAVSKNNAIFEKKKEEEKIEIEDQQPSAQSFILNHTRGFKGMEVPISPIVNETVNGSLSPDLLVSGEYSFLNPHSVLKDDLSSEDVKVETKLIQHPVVCHLNVVFAADSFDFYLNIDQYIFDKEGNKLPQEKIDWSIQTIFNNCWNFQEFYDEAPTPEQLLKVTQQDQLESETYKFALVQSMEAEDHMREFILDLHQIIPDDSQELAKLFDVTHNVEDSIYYNSISYKQIHEQYRSFLRQRIVALQVILKADPDGVRYPMLSGSREEDIKWCQEQLAIANENYNKVIAPWAKSKEIK